MAKDRFDIKEKEGVSFMTDAMIRLAKSGRRGVEIIESQDILKQ